MFCRFIGVASVVVLLAAGVFAATADEPDKPTPSVEPVKVSVSAKQKPATEIFAELAKSSGEKIVMESTVVGKVDLELNKVKLESALSALCKAVNCEWRKIYIAEDSDLIDKADRFASTVRLMLGFGFPDVVISKSSTDRVMAHLSDKSAVDAAETEVIKQKGLIGVYLVTNDAALPSKVVKPESRTQPAKTPAQDYADKTKSMMDDLLKMSPEDQEQALLASLNVYEQVGPEYMAGMMQAVMKIDKQRMNQLVARQTQMLFSMPQDTRRAMIRLGIESQSALTPEQVDMIREDTAAVMQEMGIPMPVTPQE